MYDILVLKIKNQRKNCITILVLGNKKLAMKTQTAGPKVAFF